VKFLRQTFFWLHLTLGLTAGLVIALTALTGVIMAFQPQILAWADRAQARVTPPVAPAIPLSADELLARVRAAYPDARPSALTLYSDDSRAATLTLGRNEPALYIHPHTGEIRRQENQNLRAFFTLALRLHRWLALPASQSSAANPLRGDPAQPTPSNSDAPINWREIGGTIVGASTAVFLVLTLSGLVLWWPRRWSLKALRSTTLPNFKLRGKPRDWNWHNSLGFLFAPVFILITLTGLVMAFDVVGNLLAPREMPPQPPLAALPDARPLPRGELVALAQKEIPNWENITLILQNRRQRSEPAGLAPVTISVRIRDQLTPVPVRLLYHPHTGELLERTDLTTLPLRRALRTLILPLHMGTAFGWPGQLLALAACLATLVLVYTGFALAFRRFFTRKSAPTVTTL
jgi:uncharacterized iron-regulated membrane protein